MICPSIEALVSIWQDSNGRVQAKVIMDDGERLSLHEGSTFSDDNIESLTIDEKLSFLERTVAYWQPVAPSSFLD